MNKVSSVELEGFSNHGEIEVGERVCRVRQLSNQGGFHQKEKSLLKMMQLHYPVTCLLLNIDIHQCEKLLGKNELLYLSELVPTDRPKIATSQLGFK